MNDVSVRKLLLLLSLLIGFYTLFSFVPPTLYKLGYTQAAQFGYKVYESFCHQRVERSLFIFGKQAFYSVAQLKELKVIQSPSILPNSYPEYFGHGYVGNSEVGFKVAICIRDIAMYGMFALSLFVLSFVKLKKRIDWGTVWVLILPIMLDVVVQIILERTHSTGYGLLYINSIEKRIFTGVLAGLGTAFLIKNVTIHEDEKST